MEWAATVFLFSIASSAVGLTMDRGIVVVVTKDTPRRLFWGEDARGTASLIHLSDGPGLIIKSGQVSDWRQPG